MWWHNIFHIVYVVLAVAFVLLLAFALLVYAVLRVVFPSHPMGH
jgi:hypothetical protein